MDNNNNLNETPDYSRVDSDPIVPEPVDVDDTVNAEPIVVADEDVFVPEPIPTIESEPDTAKEISGDPYETSSKESAGTTGEALYGESAGTIGEDSTGDTKSITDGPFGEEPPHYQTPPQFDDYARVGGEQIPPQGSAGQGDSHYNGYQAKAEKPASITLGILSLIFGIVSLVFFCSCLNIVTGVIAIVFGIIQLATGRGAGRGIAIGGIVTAALSIIFFFMFWGAVLGNSNLRDSVIEQYGDGNMDKFFEDYLENFDVEINGQPVRPGGGSGNSTPDMDDATQL